MKTTVELIKAFRGVNDGDKSACDYCGKAFYIGELNPDEGGTFSCINCIKEFMRRNKQSFHKK